MTSLTSWQIFPEILGLEIWRLHFALAILKKLTNILIWSIFLLHTCMRSTWENVSPSPVNSIQAASSIDDVTCDVVPGSLHTHHSNIHYYFAQKFAHASRWSGHELFKLPPCYTGPGLNHIVVHSSVSINQSLVFIVNNSCNIIYR